MCDSYKELSIKNAERELRGESEVFVINTPDIRIPENFQSFLNNGENKERLFHILEDVWADSMTEIGDRVLYVARGPACCRIDFEGKTSVPALDTDHEEADTKIAYLINHFRNNHGIENDALCVVRSQSGDIDIPVILTASSPATSKVHVFIDSGSAKPKLLDLNECKLNDLERSALLGIHAFSGNDYVSSFFRKGKPTSWKLVKSSQKFLEVFSCLGESDQLSNELFSDLEKFVCSLFGKKKLDSVNSARKEIFWDKLSKKKKIIDISFLPPCQSSLYKHCQRANFIAKMWRGSWLPMLNLPNPKRHGWSDDYTIDWVDEIYPDDVKELLTDNKEDEDEELEDEFDEESDCGEEYESETEDSDDE